MPLLLPADCDNLFDLHQFLDAIAEEPDFFLLAGHMPLQEDNWPTVFNAVRDVHPTTPIFIFGGHNHVRDCSECFCWTSACLHVDSKYISAT